MGKPITVMVQKDNPVVNPYHIEIAPIKFFIKESSGAGNLIVGVREVLVPTYNLAQPNKKYEEITQEMQKQYVVVKSKEEIPLGPVGTRHAELRAEEYVNEFFGDAKKITEKIGSYFGSFQRLAPYVAKHGMGLEVYEGKENIPLRAGHAFRGITDDNSVTTIQQDGNYVRLIFGSLVLDVAMENDDYANRLFGIAQQMVLDNLFEKNHGELNEPLLKTKPKKSKEITHAVLYNEEMVIVYFMYGDPTNLYAARNPKGKAGFTAERVGSNKPLEEIIKSMQLT